MWKFILASALGLMCLATTGVAPSEAGKGGGGGRPSSGAKPRPPQNSQFTKQPPKQTPKQPTKHHHHRHGPGISIDGDFDGSSFDGSSVDGSSLNDIGDDDDDAPAKTASKGVYGVEITALYKGTAAKEGLEIGDVILSVNGTPTPTSEALATAIARAGSKAQVLVIREDDDERETVTLFPQNGYIGVSGESVRVSK